MAWATVMGDVHRCLWLALGVSLLGCDDPVSAGPEPASEPEIEAPRPGPAEPDLGELDRLRRAVERQRRELESARARAEQDAVTRAEQEARLRAEAEELARLEAERARLEAEREAFETTYPLHGVCYHYLAQVFARADRSRVIGYMRRGAQFRAKRRVRGRDCEGGWHETPGGGFVCAGNGYRLGDEPQFFEGSPRPPALEAALPYPYAFTTRDDVLQYWRLPSLEDQELARGALDRVLAAEARAAAPPLPAPRLPAPDAGSAAPVPPAAPQEGPAVGAAPAAPEPGASPAEVVTAPVAVEATAAAVAPTAPVPEPSEPAAAPEESPTESIEAPPPPGQEPEADGAVQEEEAAAGSTEADRPFPSFVRMRMRKGFYVSVDREEEADGRRFVRTVRGGYIPHGRVQPNEPPSGRGVVLDGDEWSLPVAFVWRRGARAMSRREDGMLLDQGVVETHTPIRVVDTFRRGGREHLVGRDGTIVRDTVVRTARRADRPAGIPEGARWVHVDLSEQTLVAYEGATPVFATIVSTGKTGFETPTGLFRIESKHVSTTMDDLANEDGAYSIEDVPWTMYFDGNYALHGAFWHYSFGRPRSHGCVNLAPTDARWLFQWTTPTLPAGWHGMFTTRASRGTWVHVTE